MIKVEWKGVSFTTPIVLTHFAKLNAVWVFNYSFKTCSSSTCKEAEKIIALKMSYSFKETLND